MKKLFVCLFCCMFFLSCSDDKNNEGDGISLSGEMFTIHMAVTNDKGENLVLASDEYRQTGDYAQTYRFDDWNAYLDGNLVQSSEGNYKCRYKPVLYNKMIGQNLIGLETNAEMQRQMEDWCERHEAEYIVTSPSLFGDKKEHVIHLEVLGISDEVKQTFFIEFSVSVDGVSQEVYYPTSWEGLYPKDPYGYVDRPYFVLNVDAL